MKLIVGLSCLLLAGALQSDEAEASAPTGAPRATLSTGVVEGRYLKTRKGKYSKIFQGIPYAKPPTGDLRFRFSGWIS